jgi:hypothetical protein
VKSQEIKAGRWDGYHALGATVRIVVMVGLSFEIFHLTCIFWHAGRAFPPFARSIVISTHKTTNRHGVDRRFR